MVDGTWVIPVAGAAIEHRKELGGLLAKIDNVLRGKKRRVAITGMPGSGKTVLLDHMSGSAFHANYRPPSQSQSMETGRIVAPGQRISISVVPGQESGPRQKALQELFRGEDPVEGVIHVAANGFIDVRNEESRRVLLENGLSSVEKFRTQQLAAELEDLRSTCDEIRRAHQSGAGPSWMLVVVSKADLYTKDIRDVQRYYSSASSEFGRIMSALVSKVGEDNFRWSAMPLCTWLEDFSWADEVRSSKIRVGQRNEMLMSYMKRLEEYCGSI